MSTELSELCDKINRDCESIRLSLKIIAGECIVAVWAFSLVVTCYLCRHSSGCS